ncbi:hypothetical protein PSET11_03045 [Arthrobacter ulcerisalmonis]|uniref:Uncharacterized protein n=1 Tax=Arthrobacter ulcerisalmonis TaxID=2483813 RepID=A0A3P5XT83_9MICC|nr:hypothetical protein [Arthrobacter ulcerisalmonis]VDC32289.1 hypothetical protein PSET11_03045 [Arthrobacter ulcerisalmonis]
MIEVPGVMIAYGDAAWIEYHTAEHLAIIQGWDTYQRALDSGAWRHGTPEEYAEYLKSKEEK